MLRIIIAQKRILSSFILHPNDYGTIVEHLPGKLRARVADALKILCDNDVYALKHDNEEGVLLFQDGRAYACEPIQKFLTKDFVEPLEETVYLLGWYIIPHIHSTIIPWRADGCFVCRDCGGEQKFYNNNRCISPECPSHKKWAEVIDGYVPPKDTNHAVPVALDLKSSAFFW